MSTVWLIAYIDQKALKHIDRDLKKPLVSDIEIYIPIIKTLRKTKNAEQVFEERLLLFNYGFIKVPVSKLYKPKYLDTIKNNITCIVGWVKNYCTDIKATLQDIGGHGEKPYEAAIASEEDIKNMMKLSQEISVNSKEDIANLTVGKVVLLHGYPFDGLYATIEKIDHKNKRVKAKVHLEAMYKNQVIDFENILYSVYDNMDEGLDNRFRLDGLTVNIGM